jgi:hypothetical protein
MVSRARAEDFVMDSETHASTWTVTGAGDDFQGREAAFAAYNAHRRARLEAQAGERASEALRLLPLLLHLNQEGLPGYVEDSACPVGVSDYSPGNVVDEMGNLVHFTHAREGEPYTLARLIGFLEDLFPGLSAQPKSPLRGPRLSQCLRIHTLLYEGTCRVVSSTAEHLNRVRSLGLDPVGLTIERGAGKGGLPSGYVITWADQVIRSVDVPDPLEELRARIRAARHSGLEYDSFVTRLFLDERFVENHCGAFVSTGHYLFYKKAIEGRLSW